MPGISTLLVNPPGITQHRQNLFELHTKFSLSSRDHATIWPYMSNVWSFKNKNLPTATAPYTDHHYHCRLRRAPDVPKALRARINNRNVNGRKHEVTKCNCTMKVREYVDGRREYIAISGFLHTHDLDYSDLDKINEVVKQAV